MKPTVFIIHGTEGHPQENWFPWMRQELELQGFRVITPHFPSPPVVPANIDEWREVWKQYKQFVDENTIIIGHSLGGIFTLRLLEAMNYPINAAIFTGTPIGIKPIKFYDRDKAFSGFDFDWARIRQNAGQFAVFHSDNDPYVDLANGRQLSTNLEVELDFVPNAGHFNKIAGYVKFELLKDTVLELASSSEQF